MKVKFTVTCPKCSLPYEASRIISDKTQLPEFPLPMWATCPRCQQVARFTIGMTIVTATPVEAINV